jgi:hypothetical protein
MELDFASEGATSLRARGSGPHTRALTMRVGLTLAEQLSLATDKINFLPFSLLLSSFCTPVFLAVNDAPKLVSVRFKNSVTD